MRKIAIVIIIVFLLFGCGGWKHDFNFRIHSIERELVTSGSFFLGSGSVNGKMYFFMWRDWNGGLKFVRLPHDISTIYEDENNHPYVEVYEHWNLGQKYKIHVPQNTILKEFRL